MRNGDMSGAHPARRTLPVVHAVVWSDYLCPWCYLGLARSAQLEALGVDVTPLPYELHPEIPPEGWSVKEDRGRRLYARIAAECEEAGLEPPERPLRIPNTRAVLAASEWVRRNCPPAVHKALHRSLFDAMFRLGLDLGSPTVVDDLVAAAGADPAACRAAVDSGAMDAALADSRERAVDAGVSGTPAWLIDDRLLIPGVQSPEYVARMVERLRRPRP
jgi:predicted DsbA family dithiol-disulfide isomerase